ncbi:DUF6519 domain-containing protein [Halomonas cerina]|uniref:Right handed beta helix domain-containing protein n=1 Tax=Halomonas cerina TaxID=447424 RepID=A0A839V879_9GAMM|nr:DUF6519 domain-containing protein [Halomonas cerina]MBB3191863.1 hypothetical protein [Halomonas cerina]
MKGDLSRFEFRPEDNFTGTVHQQGRGLLDQDGNAATSIQRHLRELLGQDTIGPDVVAVPVQEGESFKVARAVADGSEVKVTLQPGRGWVDGLHLHLPAPDAFELTAAYLGPPIQSPAADPGTIAADERDAVILEVWEESFSAFQDPALLLEPALGGPDTTARVKLQYALRLLRLGPDDVCGNLAGILSDDFDAKGKLTVTPSATTAVAGDCPVQLAGGYTGFEHYLFRIEVARPDGDGKARFKWSRFNGGLVGRGTYTQATDTIQVTANDQAINTAGREAFYLEALAYDADYGHWRLVMTATQTTLVADGQLELQGTVDNPGGVSDGDELFFRLWDGIERVEAFQSGAGAHHPLSDGIELAFDPPTADNGNYTPGDYWTFPVRAAGAEFEDLPWPNDDPPEGVRYHRAPLAVLEWDGGPNVALDGPSRIHDCRRVFQPLTRLDDCCTYRVGDGMVSHGDFASIQAAVDSLPAGGGQICVLPGRFEENIIVHKANVTIRGCGHRSQVVSPAPETGDAEPVFHLKGPGSLRLESLAIEAHETGTGVLVEDAERDTGPSFVTLDKLVIQAATRCGIKARAGHHLTIRDCRITMADQASQWPGVFVVADDVLIEHNTIDVRSLNADQVSLPHVPGVVHATAGRGGLQVGGTCERVQVIDNLIQHGIGNGITLGSVEEVDVDGNVVDADIGWVVGGTINCDPCAPGGVFVPPGGGEEEDRPSYASAGTLYEIRLERNRILDMGLNGIGVVAFFDIERQPDLISVEDLDILGNTIRGCLQRELQEIPTELSGRVGYGGIALAHVESLTVRDNHIERNGPDAAEPVCGVFLLQTEDADIDRNRITDNGARTAETPDNSKRGPRAGIWITQALAPTQPLDSEFGNFLVQHGIPAARIHNNVVSQPLGPAVIMMAAGPVSVQGNHLTSRGVVPGTASVGFIAATVMIMNMGMTPLVGGAKLGTARFYTGRGAYGYVPMAYGAQAVGGDAIEVAHSSRESSTAVNVGKTFVRGDLHFCNNTVESDGIEPEGSFSLTSVLLLSLDDVACNDNQFTCMYQPGQDFAFTDLMALGMSVRVDDNRFKEVYTGQGLAVLFSAVSIGLLMNHTTDNQANHCLFAHNLARWAECNLEAVGSVPFMVFKDNLQMPDLISCQVCRVLPAILKAYLGNSVMLGGNLNTQRDFVIG